MAFILDDMSSAEILGISTAAISVAFVWFFIVPLTHWRRKGIPHVSAVPILGSGASSFFQKISMAEEHQRIYQEMEGYRYAGFYKFQKPSLLLRDSELIKDVMVKDFFSFHDNDFDVTISVDPMMGRNLFFTKGELWKRIRSALTPAFSSGKLKTVYPLMLGIIKDLKQYLEELEHPEMELKEVFARFSTNVVASCAFGIKIDALRKSDEEFRRYGREIMEPTPARGLVLLMIMNSSFFARILRLKVIPTKCADFFRQVVRDVASIRQKTGEVRNDFLNMMMILKSTGKLGVHLDEEGMKRQERSTKEDVDLGKLQTQNIERILNDPESLDDITAQLLGFVLDGQDTASTLMSFALFELAHNPDVQEKVRAEVAMVKSAHGGTITYEALHEMPYLEMVQQEALRKYPPAPFTVRRCTKRYLFPPADERTPKENGGFWVEPGTPVLISIYAMHRDPKYYPNPEVFDPERFSKESERTGKGIYLPFGDGPRMCIGNRFARLLSKAVIAEVVSNFKLMPCIEKTPVPIELDPTSLLLFSKKNLWVTFEKL